MRKTFYLLLLVLISTNRPLAQTGLDPSFGAGGLVTTNPVFGSSHDFIHSMAIQQDGKIVVAGLSNGILTLARYNTDGSLDPGFGSGGIAQHDISGEVGVTHTPALKILPDGTLLVAAGVHFGASPLTSGVFLVRYLPNGILDAAFGNGGKIQVTETIDDAVIIATLALQGDKIIVGHSSMSFYKTLCRVNNDGSPDPSFGADLALVGLEILEAIAVQSDNKILVAGPIGGNFVLRRLFADGTLEGTTTTDFGGAESPNNIEIQPDGKIIVAGNSGGNIAMARYTTGGIPDPGFGTGGKLISNWGGDDRLQDIVIQADGKIVGAGSRNILDPVFTSARYLENGQLDICYGVGGILSINFPGLSGICKANSVALQSDGKIILAGAAAQSLLGPSDFALVRYTPASQVTWYYDADLDGYGTNANTQMACLDPDCVLDPIWGITCPDPNNWVLVGGDCNDNDAATNPGATEICNAKDDNCDGNIDEGVSPLTWYRDADLDGYGTDANTQVSCTDPSIPEIICDVIIPGCIPEPEQKWVAQGGDCNDNDAAIHPGATETCNTKDDNCDGNIDEGIPTQSYYTDADGDGYGTGTAQEFCSDPGTGYTTVAGDCNDNDAAVHPSSSNTTELCDGVDNDCDGLIDEGCSGKPVINIGDAVVYESEGDATITISLSHITTLAVKINYTTSNGTAVSTKKEKDYKSIGNTALTIPPGTLSTTITVPVYNDGKAENNEYFYVNLIRPTNCVLGDVTGMVNILDGAPVTSARGHSETIAARVVDEEPVVSGFDVKAYPNPSSDMFILRVTSDDLSTPVQVRVISATGQSLKKLNGAVGRDIRFGNDLKAGFFIAEIMQGKNKKILKLFKY